MSSSSDLLRHFLPATMEDRRRRRPDLRILLVVMAVLLVVLLPRTRTQMRMRIESDTSDNNFSNNKVRDV